MNITKYSLVAAGLLASNLAFGYTLTNSPDCDAAAAVFDPAYDSCSGAYLLDGGENDVTSGEADNIVNQILNDDDVFGADDWTFGGKFDGAYSGMSGLFSVTGLNTTSGAVDLNTSLLGGSGEFDVVLSFKAGKNFSLYAWTPLDESPASGDFGNIEWSTSGTSVNRNGDAKELSHVSVYYRQSGVTTVFEPMTVGLFALGLFGVGAIRRKR